MSQSGQMQSFIYQMSWCHILTHSLFNPIQVFPDAGVPPNKYHIVPWISHYLFLTYPSQFIIHYHWDTRIHLNTAKEMK